MMNEEGVISEVVVCGGDGDGKVCDGWCELGG